MTCQVVALALVPLFLVILSLLVSRAFDETEVLRDEVVHSYESRVELRHILSTHRAMEAGLGGFILTSDASYLSASRFLNSNALRQA